MYLVDTSALVRILQRQTDTKWNNLEDRGLLTVCEPIFVETLRTAATGGLQTW